MSKAIWDNPNWPNVTYDVEGMRPFEDRYIYLCGITAGSTYNLPMYLQSSIGIALLEEEGIYTSLIEGEELNRSTLHSSLRRLLSQLKPMSPPRPEDAVAGFLTATAGSLHAPLTEAVLSNLDKIVLSGRAAKGAGGQLRDSSKGIHNQPCYIGDETQPFVPPETLDVPTQMAHWLAWFNSSASHIPALTRAAIAHLWFCAIQPYEAGNGYLVRAITQMALRHSHGSNPVCMLSEILHLDQANYRERLCAALHQGELNQWLSYFAQTILKAQERSIDRIRHALSKDRFHEHFAHLINDRQNNVVSRMLADGPDGFAGGISAAEYRSITRASTPTTTRDLNKLVERGILRKVGRLRYARYHIAI